MTAHPRIPFTPTHLVVGFSLLAVLGLRILACWTFSLNSDEPQHAHVVWAWAQGQVPYRDFFDNHSPLFHWLYRPVLLSLGERPDVMGWLRLAVLPLLACTVAFTGVAGARLFTPTVGWAAAALVAAFPPFFIYGGQFRADGLWATLTLAGLVISLRLPHTGRCFGLGLVAGAAFGASLKGAFVLASVGLGAASLLLLSWVGGWRPSRSETKSVLFHTGLLAAGALVVPACLAAYFWIHGAMGDLVFCLFSHNAMAGLKAHRLSRFFVPPCWLLPIACVYAFVEARRRTVGAWSRGWCALSAAWYVVILVGALSHVTKQDLMPLYPVVAIFFAGAAAAGLRRFRLLVPGRVGVVLLAALLLVELGCLGVLAIRKRHRDPIGNQLLTAVLRLTRPDERVLDAKGEAVFRSRAIRPVFEAFTARRLAASGAIDTIPAALAASRTAVVIPSKLYPAATTEFLRSNYLSVGPVAVLGQVLRVGPDRRVQFETTVPGEYVWLAGHNPVAGELDGRVVRGPVPIEAGSHQFRPEGSAREVTLLWARAWSTGFFPP